jgi:hypothetical protein
MKWWGVLLVVIPAAVLGTTPLISRVESQPLSVVEGQLRDQNGAPVAYQPVVIEATEAKLKVLWWLQKNPILIKALTDEKGVFQVIDLPPGKKYNVKALKPDAEIIPIGFFETPPHAYGTINVSDKLNRIKDPVWNKEPR